MRVLGKYAVAAILVVVLVLVAIMPAQAQGQVHTVQRGETMWSIATRYGTTVDAIARANGLANPRFIYAGQRLTVPLGGGGGAGTAATGGTYTVRRGDSLSSIASRHGTTVNALVQANGLRNPSYIYAGQKLVIRGGGGSAPATGQAASAGGATYTVRRGDTLSSIASRHGTTASAIARVNGLANLSYIYVGQRLSIPSGGGGAAAVATGGGKRILINLSDQRMYVYQNGQLLWNWVVSTGRPGQSTITGSFKVLNRIPNAYAATWGLQMPYWLGIYWAGSLQNGIHALPIQANGQRLWDGYLGRPVSFGCIILSVNNAATLYNWAPVGTPVDIVW